LGGHRFFFLGVFLILVPNFSFLKLGGGAKRARVFSRFFFLKKVIFFFLGATHGEFGVKKNFFFWGGGYLRGGGPLNKIFFKKNLVPKWGGKKPQNQLKIKKENFPLLKKKFLEGF